MSFTRPDSVHLLPLSMTGIGRSKGLSRGTKTDKLTEQSVNRPKFTPPLADTSHQSDEQFGAANSTYSTVRQKYKVAHRSLSKDLSFETGAYCCRQMHIQIGGVYFSCCFYHATSKLDPCTFTSVQSIPCDWQRGRLWWRCVQRQRKIWSSFHIIIQ